MPTTKLPLKTYDFTLSFKSCNSYLDILEAFKQRVNKYVFQLEQSDNNYIHWQGRFSLIKPKYFHEVIKLFKDTKLNTAYITPSSSNSVLKDYYGYCEKIDTRVPNTKTYKDTDAYTDINIKHNYELKATNKTKKTTNKREIIKNLMKEKKNIEIISKNVDIKINSLDKYIVDILEHDDDVDIDLDYFSITPEYEIEIKNAIKIVGMEKLRPIKDLINENITWLQIKIYIIVFKIEQD